MARGFNFSSNYPESLLADYMEIMTSIPLVPETEVPVSQYQWTSYIKMEKPDEISMLPNPNKQLLQYKKRKFHNQRNLETPSPPSFYQEDPQFYHDSPSTYQNSETSENCEESLNYFENNYGFQGYQSETQPEEFCATDEKTCAALILANMSQTPRTKNTFRRSLPALRHARNKLNATDNEEIRIMAEIKATQDITQKEELRLKLKKLKKENRIAKRIKEIREMLANCSYDFDVHKLSVLLTKKYKPPGISLEGSIKRWNRNCEPKNCHNNEKNENLPNAIKSLSTVFVEEPQSYNYKHKKVNYRKFLNSSVAPFRDLRFYQFSRLSDEMKDRIINLKLTYYKCAIENLKDCNKYFPLSYAYNENKSRIRTDYEDNENGTHRVKNNMASRRSRNRRKYHVFVMTNTVDFDCIMIKILETAVDSATKSIISLEKKMSDYPDLISEYRTLSCLEI